MAQVRRSSDKKKNMKRRHESSIENGLKELNTLNDEVNTKLQRLRDLDLFVLDNSLRETTVGALRGHTLENKFEIYNECKKVGLNHNIVASFSHMTRIGDTFIQELKKQKEDFSDKYAFSEFCDGVDANKIPLEAIPVGMQKCKELGIKHVIIEADLLYYAIDYKKFTHEAMCNLFDARFKWIRKHVAADSRILINLRDLPDAMKKNPERSLETVKFLASYRPQIFAILTEESGKYFPDELGVLTKVCKNVMNANDFTGHFLIHVHQQWGIKDMIQIECLANGATGIWAGICEEGASLGHASSALTIMNLIRLGNTKILSKFNCPAIREAAINVTKIVTGKPPHPKTPVYGARALDQVFGLPQFDPEQATDVVGTFDLAKFFNTEATMRITTLADSKMVKTRMERLFGAHRDINLKIAEDMRVLMLDDLRDDRKEEYHSAVGLATLFDRAGGQKTQGMVDAIAKFEIKSVHIKHLIEELHNQWKDWDLRDGVQDDRLTFDNFYDGFMKAYFGCYRCVEARKALKAININDDESIDWKEFVVFLKWAGHEYPQTETAEELLDIAFREGVIPAMQDEVVRSLVK